MDNMIIGWALGLFLVIVGVSNYFIWRDRFANWAQTKGKIVAVRLVPYPAVSFSYKIKGRELVGSSSYWGRKGSEGREVTVYYNPDDPEEAEYTTPALYKFYTFVLPAFGLAWLALFHATKGAILAFWTW